MLDRAKELLREHLRAIIIILLVIQPMLDVLSYAMTQLNMTLLTTLLRFALLGLVGLLGFLVTDRKPLYFALYGVMAVFWILHAANCFRTGYISLYEDTANYLRILSLPIFFLAFLAFLREDRSLWKAVCVGMAVNLLEIILFTAIPWLIGQPVYTYETLQVGVMGWFSVANAQSAVIVLVVPLAVYWGYRFGPYWGFLGLSLLGFGLMFATGTKLTFYSILIIAGAFVFLLVMSWRKQNIKYIVPLLVILVVVVAFRGKSPMQVREGMSSYAQGNYQKLVEASIKESGVDAEALEELQDSESKEIPDTERLAALRRSLTGVYTDPKGYGPLFTNLCRRFGLYNVLENYDYTTSTQVLSNSRVRKTAFAQMMWQEKDLPTHLLGFEYGDMLYGGDIYDLENDFPAVFYFCGYVGFALYLLFFLYVAVTVLRAFAGDVADAWRKTAPGRSPLLRGALAFFGGLRQFLTPEMGAVGMTFLLAVIAAQLSGNVLRRPNVAIYMAAAAAYLCSLARARMTGKRK